MEVIPYLSHQVLTFSSIPDILCPIEKFITEVYNFFGKFIASIRSNSILLKPAIWYMLWILFYPHPWLPITAVYCQLTAFATGNGLKAITAYLLQ
jgi:hypothetical protein